MTLKSVTYTSLAQLDLTADHVADIHQTAMRNNALDGITGLLIFNGTHFLQVIEGDSGAIEGLLAKLRSDPRHHGVEIRDQRMIDLRSFPDWSMELIRVKARFFEARDAITSVLPTDLPGEVSARIIEMTERISRTVELPDG
jgi:hypothetical protein